MDAKTFHKIVIYFFGILFLVALVFKTVSATFIEVVSIEVTDVYFVHAKEDSKWIVLTKNEMFENEPSFFFKKTDKNVKELARLQPKKYLAAVQGIAIPWLGVQRNILAVAD